MQAKLLWQPGDRCVVRVPVPAKDPDDGRKFDLNAIEFGLAGVSRGPFNAVIQPGEPLTVVAAADGLFADLVTVEDARGNHFVVEPHYLFEAAA